MAKSKFPARRHLPKGLIVLYEDDDLIVIDKPAGMLTMGTDREKERTAYFALTSYVRKGNSKSRNRIFIVHRLDRETSGVLVFAKNEGAKIDLQTRWESVEKKYLAVVYGTPKDKKGSITSFLVENQTHRVYSTEDQSRGQFARTDYKVLGHTKLFSVLEITLHTGRKHQIRVHLSDFGHPIVGDRKYGPEERIEKRLALHACSLALTHPSTRERMTFEAPPPDWFERLVPRSAGKTNSPKRETAGIPPSEKSSTARRKRARTST